MRVNVCAAVALATMLLAQAPFSTISSADECDRVYFGERKANNIACKCNESHCDQLQFEWPQDERTFLRLVSDLSGARFEQSSLQLPADDVGGSNRSKRTKGNKEQNKIDYVLEVQIDRRHQQVTGFGGSITDSAAMVVDGLSAELRQRWLDDYFSERGLDYNMGRVPIGGSDMSTRPYSYDDEMPNGEREDLELKYFKLQEEDLRFKLPLIRRINEMRAKRNLSEVKLFAATWSQPAWMKNNSHLVQGALKGNHMGPYYNVSAKYLVRFLEEYERQQVPIWALTAQNEPFTPGRPDIVNITFNSVNYGPEEMANYLEYNLIPALKAANRTQKTKLFFFDDGLLGLAPYYEAILKRPQVLEHLSGVAIHWYSHFLGRVPYTELRVARQQLSPHLSFVSVEASHQQGPKPGDWERGAAYARDIIANLRAGSTSWVDWNLSLNMSGGPTWMGNVLDAPILVDVPNQVYYKNPMFYALGHLTRFVLPNSHVVPSILVKPTTTASNSAKEDADTLLDVVAVELEEPLKLNGGGQIRRRFSLVALNRANETRRIQLELIDCKTKNSPLEFELSGQSLTSLAFIC